MVRYGSVSVGVAVEQETSFHSSDASHPLLNSSGTSLLYNNPTSNLSSPPNVTSTTTHHQSLRITFAYQAGSGAMSDVIITLSDRDQQQLIQTGSLTSLERGALMAQNRKMSESPIPTTFGNEMQVYTVETADKYSNNTTSKDGGVKFGKIYIEEIPNSPKKESKLKAICDSDDNNNVSEKTPEEKTDKESQEVISMEKGKEIKKQESIDRERSSENKDEIQEGSPKKEKRDSEEKEIKANDEKITEEEKDGKKKKEGAKGKVKKSKGKVRESSVNASLGKINGQESASSEEENKNNNKSKKVKKNKIGKQVTFSPARDRRARSMSKSRIPIINSVAHEYYPCEYYRQKLMCDHGVCDYHTCWMNFPEIKKSAGQKVVKKMTTQQKKLEDAAAKKKVEFVLDDEEFPDKPLQALIPMKKRPTRLEPILVRRNK